MGTRNASTQTEKSALRAYDKKISEKAIAKQVASSIINNPTTVVIQSCEFEIFGIVQDVSFRHYTLRRAQKLDIRGWCMNSPSGTVIGVIQGLPRSFEAMRLWLRYTGSPTSRIDKCVFGVITELDKFTFDDFTIRISNESEVTLFLIGT